MTPTPLSTVDAVDAACHYIRTHLADCKKEKLASVRLHRLFLAVHHLERAEMYLGNAGLTGSKK